MRLGDIDTSADRAILADFFRRYRNAPEIFARLNQRTKKQVMTRTVITLFESSRSIQRVVDAVLRSDLNSFIQAFFPIASPGNKFLRIGILKPLRMRSRKLWKGRLPD